MFWKIVVALPGRLQYRLVLIVDNKVEYRIEDSKSLCLYFRIELQVQLKN